MDAVNPLKILNTLNLDPGAAKHSEHSEFGTWWCFERTL